MIPITFDFIIPIELHIFAVQDGITNILINQQLDPHTWRNHSRGKDMPYLNSTVFFVFHV